MKGIVFTEFLEMVESKFGYEMVDDMLTQNDLPSGGVYTAIGTYDHREIVTLVSHLHQKSQIPVASLLYAFGQHLFQTFSKSYQQFFVGVNDAFDFLESIENHIHVEVKKLYPDAELPRFEPKRLDEKKLQMIYRSDRRMADLAEGLIASAMQHYGTEATITRETLDEKGAIVKFLIEKN